MTYQFRSSLRGLLISLAAICAITYLCLPAHGVLAPAMLYLLVVVLESLWGRLASATAVSIAAAACLDYFFIPPLFALRIRDNQDAIALVTYVATSLVITRLSSKAQSEARRAERKRQETGLLYEASSRLLSLSPDAAAGAEPARIIRQVFHLESVCLFDISVARSQTDPESAGDLAAKTQDACIRATDLDDPERRIHIRLLSAGGKTTGAAGFQGSFRDESMISAVTALAAHALERVQSYRAAARVAADAQAEMLRCAIVDAFAHEFKTPLAIITAAAGSLRETSAAPGEQNEMTDIIETQTIRLSQLTTRLLRLSRLNREEVAPKMERVDILSLVSRLLRQYELQTGRRFALAASSRGSWVIADPELAGLAIGQLFDNASKYSPSGSVIRVSLETGEASADVLVANSGLPIRAADKDRIFNRFARGSGAEEIAGGSGLGLYVARKIAIAHGGFLRLEDNGLTDGHVKFRIGFPVLQNERKQQQVCQSVGG